ncbi:MAG: hypothetical protein CW338_10710 [Clostridiales bacterium]|nr:hypothetical protein [Clostridiales bacterium]
MQGKITDKQILRSIKKLAQLECCNYDRGMCIETDERCHLIHPDFDSIRDGAIDCDYFMDCVLPASWELDDLVNYALWYDDEDEEPDYRACKICGKPFLPDESAPHQLYCRECGERKKKRDHAHRSREYRRRKK